MFKVLSKIGEGTFGDVFKAKHIETDRLVALKRIRLRKIDDGLPRNVLREIKALEHIEHNNIIQLYGYRAFGLSVELALEYMVSDLYRIIQKCVLFCRKLTNLELKTILYKILKGVAVLHEHHIMHRDIKPSNILFAPNGEVKLGDLGLACVYEADDETKEYSHEVATRWYRAPELIYGARRYSPAVDLWSIGCILGELLTMCPLFPGDSDIDQLHRIFKLLGTPNIEEWPEVINLPDYKKISFPTISPSNIYDIFPMVNPLALDLLQKLLTLTPNKRITAKEALEHAFFKEKPLPGEVAVLRNLLRCVRIDTSNHVASLRNFNFNR